jgi:hypothetical protein
LKVGPGAYPRVEHLKDASICSELTCKHQTRLKRLVRDKYFSLLQTFVNDTKIVFNIGFRISVKPTDPLLREKTSSMTTPPAFFRFFRGLPTDLKVKQGVSNVCSRQYIKCTATKATVLFKNILFKFSVRKYLLSRLT